MYSLETCPPSGAHSLRVEIPCSYVPEREYVVRAVMTDILGIAVTTVVRADARGTRISIGDGKSLEVTDGLFASAPESWLQEDSIPRTPLPIWRLNDTLLRPVVVNSDLPVICGDRSPSFNVEGEKACLTLDVFGGAFFMLSRYEETAIKTRDEHGRFPLSLSLAARAGFLFRPIVNEYSEVLWAALIAVWPSLERTRRDFRTFSTHDVDGPFAYLNSGPATAIRVMAREVVRNHDGRGAARQGMAWNRVRRHGPSHDPSNTFDRIMDLCDTASAECAFFFIPDSSPVRRQKLYSLDEPEIESLMRKIHTRGHEIGIHPSYRAHRNFAQLDLEVRKLRRKCEQLGIVQRSWGGRHHFLRWESTESFQLWDDCGLSYDSTLSYAESPGYRCGVCQPYRTFNTATRMALGLVERPLVIMEKSITSRQYLGLRADADEALALVEQLRSRTRLFNGEFVVLWHNNSLADPLQAELYRLALDG